MLSTKLKKYLSNLKSLSDKAIIKDEDLKTKIQSCLLDYVNSTPKQDFLKIESEIIKGCKQAGLKRSSDIQEITKNLIESSKYLSDVYCGRVKTIKITRQ